MSGGDYEDVYLDTSGALIESIEQDAYEGGGRLVVSGPPWRCRCGKTGGEHSDYQWSVCWPRINMKEAR